MVCLGSWWSGQYLGLPSDWDFEEAIGLGLLKMLFLYSIVQGFIWDIEGSVGHSFKGWCFLCLRSAISWLISVVPLVITVLTTSTSVYWLCVFWCCFPLFSLLLCVFFVQILFTTGEEMWLSHNIVSRGVVLEPFLIFLYSSQKGFDHYIFVPIFNFCHYLPESNNVLSVCFPSCLLSK